MTDRQYGIVEAIVHSMSLSIVDIPSFSDFSLLAGVSAQTLCRHFESKAELLERIAEYLAIKEETALSCIGRGHSADMKSSLAVFLKAGFSALEKAYLLDEKYSIFLDYCLPKASPFRKAAFSAACWSGFLPEGAIISRVPDDGRLVSACDEILSDNRMDLFYAALSALSFSTPVTVSNISGRLGIAPSTIYSHYSDKSALEETCCKGEVQRFINVLTEARERIADPDGILLALYYITSCFISEGGVLTRNLLLAESQGRFRSLLSPEELFVTLAAVYCSGMNTREIIPFLERGIEP